MAVDREDEHFIEVITQSIDRLEGGAFSDATALWRKESHSLLRSAGSALSDLVAREDIEEIEAQEALRVMRQSRGVINTHFFDVLAALDIKLGELRLAHKSEADTLKPLAQFLNRYHEGEFSSLRHVAAVSQARRACELGAHWRADAGACRQLSDSVDAFEQARADVGKEGAEAVSAYGELVEGRSLARICYLSARDLMSAALRFEGRHDELESLMPSLSTIFRIGFS